MPLSTPGFQVSGLRVSNVDFVSGREVFSGETVENRFLLRLIRFRIDLLGANQSSCPEASMGNCALYAVEKGLSETDSSVVS
jgi:hypothetical protein